MVSSTVFTKSTMIIAQLVKTEQKRQEAKQMTARNQTQNLEKFRRPCAEPVRHVPTADPGRKRIEQVTGCQRIRSTDFNSVSENLYYVFSVNGDTIGTAIPTFVYAKKVKGFAGEVPVLIGFNRRQVRKGMTLLKHHESQE